MSSTVQRLLHALEHLDADDVRDVRLLLQKKLGLDGPDSSGVREPRTPIPPTLTSKEERCL